MSKTFVVANVKTTGPHVESGELLELAAVLVDSFGTVATEFSTLVSTAEPVPNCIKNETGITQTEIDREGRPIHEVIKAFVDFAGSHPHGTRISPGACESHPWLLCEARSAAATVWVFAS